ncbi:MAG: hypothetical protein ACRD1Z_22955, partial [Vicinamibacteria bacterium]
PRDLDRPDAGIVLRLNDGSEETLNPASLTIGAKNVLYCNVKKGDYRARFTRPAYYELARVVTENGDSGGYAIRVAGRLHPIRYADSPARLRPDSNAR